MFLVFPDHGWRAEVLAVLEITVAGDLNVQVPVGGQPPGLLPVTDVELDIGPSRQLRVADPEERDVLRGRPCEVEDGAAERSDLLGLAAFGRDHPDGAELLEAGGLAVRSEMKRRERPSGEKRGRMSLALALVSWSEWPPWKVVRQSRRAYLPSSTVRRT